MLDCFRIQIAISGLIGTELTTGAELPWQLTRNRKKDFLKLILAETTIVYLSKLKISFKYNHFGRFETVKRLPHRQASQCNPQISRYKSYVEDKQK